MDRYNSSILMDGHGYRKTRDFLNRKRIAALKRGDVISACHYACRLRKIHCGEKPD